MRIVLLCAEVWHSSAQLRMINSAIRALKLVRLYLEILCSVCRIRVSLLIAIIHKASSSQFNLQ